MTADDKATATRSNLREFFSNRDNRWLPASSEGALVQEARSRDGFTGAASSCSPHAQRAVSAKCPGVRAGDIDRTTWTAPGPGGLIGKGTKGERVRKLPIIEEAHPMATERLDSASNPDTQLFTGQRGGPRPLLHASR